MEKLSVLCVLAVQKNGKGTAFTYCNIEE